MLIQPGQQAGQRGPARGGRRVRRIPGEGLPDDGGAGPGGEPALAHMGGRGEQGAAARACSGFARRLHRACLRDGGGERVSRHGFGTDGKVRDSRTPLASAVSREGMPIGCEAFPGPPARGTLSFRGSGVRRNAAGSSARHGWRTGHAQRRQSGHLATAGNGHAVGARQDCPALEKHRSKWTWAARSVPSQPSVGSVGVANRPFVVRIPASGLPIPVRDRSVGPPCGARSRVAGAAQEDPRCRGLQHAGGQGAGNETAGGRSGCARTRKSAARK